MQSPLAQAKSLWLQVTGSTLRGEKKNTTDTKSRQTDSFSSATPRLNIHPPDAAIGQTLRVWKSRANALAKASFQIIRESFCIRSVATGKADQDVNTFIAALTTGGGGQQALRSQKILYLPFSASLSPRTILGRS